MFTQGLDNNALQWVRQKGGLNPTRLGVDPIIGARNGSNGFGLPQTSKFGNGHFAASSIPISRTMPGGSIDSGSESDDGVDIDYSLDSSPQDERALNNKAYKYGNPLQRPSGWNVHREDEFSDSAASSDFSTTQGWAHGVLCRKLELILSQAPARD